MKRFSVFALFFLGLLTVGAGCWTTTVPTNQAPSNANASQVLSVNLVVNRGEGNTTVYPMSVSVGVTALSLLQRVAAEQNFLVTTREFDFGTLVTGIDGVTATDTMFWIFYVNGEAATAGAGAYELKNGDTVEFRYTSG